MWAFVDEVGGLRRGAKGPEPFRAKARALARGGAVVGLVPHREGGSSCGRVPFPATGTTPPFGSPHPCTEATGGPPFGTAPTYRRPPSPRPQRTHAPQAQPPHGRYTLHSPTRHSSLPPPTPIAAAPHVTPPSSTSPRPPRTSGPSSCALPRTKPRRDAPVTPPPAVSSASRAYAYLERSLSGPSPGPPAAHPHRILSSNRPPPSNSPSRSQGPGSHPPARHITHLPHPLLGRHLRPGGELAKHGGEGGGE